MDVYLSRRKAMINLNQFDPTLVVPKNDVPFPKDPSHLTDSHPSEKHKETLFDNTMSDECSQSIHSVDMHNDLALNLEESKLEGSPYLSRRHASHKRYMHFRWARKKKPWDKELIITKQAKYSKKKDPGKQKCFIYDVKGYFTKECPKSRKSKREA
ncbi:hypothetical protein FXO37_10704 [Capsicum annuum]|nr:hypothetical protein FXO37_10704 [Capsicum annuum]